MNLFLIQVRNKNTIKKRKKKYSKSWLGKQEKMLARMLEITITTNTYKI